jgi:hypothetical protein
MMGAPVVSGVAHRIPSKNKGQLTWHIRWHIERVHCLLTNDVLPTLPNGYWSESGIVPCPVLCGVVAPIGCKASKSLKEESLARHRSHHWARERIKFDPGDHLNEERVERDLILCGLLNGDLVFLWNWTSVNKSLCLMCIPLSYSNLPFPIQTKLALFFIWACLFNIVLLDSIPHQSLPSNLVITFRSNVLILVRFSVFAYSPSFRQLPIGNGA